MIPLLTALLWVGPASSADDGCAAPVAAEAWAGALEQAEAAFIDLDRGSFAERMRGLEAALPCLDFATPPPVAARYHRLVGLEQFVLRDEERARLAFAAARATDPLGALPAELLPAGHVARALSESASTPGETQPLWTRDGVQLYLDGQPGDLRPADRNTLLQVERYGQITASVYLRPEDRLPPGVWSRSARRALLWASGSALTVGVALGAVALAP